MALVTGLETISVTIASGTSLSPAVATGAKTLVGIVMPATWTAASLTFQASIDDTNYGDLYDSDSGTEVSYSVVAGKFYRVNSSAWFGVNALKFRSGTSASAVNQGADRVITLVVRSL